MKHFQMDSHMVTLRGVFYPTGHIVAMLPGQGEAEDTAHAITAAGISGDEVSLLPPDTILGPIAQTVGSTDMPLPSPGTEAQVVRELARHASQGEWGVMVHVPKKPECERVMAVLRDHPVTFAERYRSLVIEDIELH